MRPPGRAARSTQRGKVLYKLLGVLAGGALLVYGVQGRSDITRVQKLGKPAVVAPITGYSEYRSRGATTYTAEFRFKTEGGLEIVRKQSFPKELIADFQAGAPVRVLYLPNDPHTFVFEKERPSWLLVALGGALALAALILA
jgi:hypothetical protein